MAICSRICRLRFLNILATIFIFYLLNSPGYSEELKLNVKGIEFSMMSVTAGSFTMGSPTEEPNHEKDENQHKVTISKDFYIGKYEVTQDLYQAVMGKNPSKFNDNPKNPVENTSWNNANEFCFELNKLTETTRPKGLRFDIPTEAQWEYACRAGTTTPFNNTNTDNIIWLSQNSQGKTHQVGQKAPNAWGLYDMHGNVWEWCKDWYDEKYPAEEVIDPEGPKYASNRVARGGSWYCQPYQCRSAYRKQFSQGNTDTDIGFRIVLVYDNKPIDNRINRTQKVFKVKDIEFTMEPIPAGSFTMGSSQDELDHSKDETAHNVTISKEFYMAQFPVTQELYQAVMGKNPSKFADKNNPVEGVSWNNAKEFCHELNQLASSTIPEGYKFDLPTEAQWEYACRAGTTTSLNSGKDITTKNGFCGYFYEVGWYRSYSEDKTHPVGQKAPNAWGLYDMHGNVWEWCRDWYDENYPEDGVIDPEGPKHASNRVARGGSWYCQPYQCRSAYRKQFSQGKTDTDIGFRIALVPYTKHYVQKTDNNFLRFKVKDQEILMEPIPEGTFTMGSPNEELGHDKDETLHNVNISKAFYIARFPVTQAVYQAVMGNNPSSFKDDNSPVENVSWNNAIEFCHELNMIASYSIPKGYKFDLPTEAQWEYACRAGSKTSLNIGEDITVENGICPHIYEVGWSSDYSEGKTHPVGQKLPNTWHLYDMHGNVWEWCKDWYDENYPADGAIDPEGSQRPSKRVVRGGSWYCQPYQCRSAYRKSFNQGHKANDCGFRIVLVPHKKLEIEYLALPEYSQYDDGVNISYMVHIPSGTYMMGSPENELGRSADEVQHEVTISEDFYISKYPVTQSQFEKVMGYNPSTFKDPNSPVENVSWCNAKEFIYELTRRLGYGGKKNLPEGYRYDLPTEAQWEFACRAGTTTALNSGENLSTTGNCCPRLYEVGWNEHYSEGKTHPVGLKLPNKWRVSDMHGNVLEWCRDWYDKYNTMEHKDPQGPRTGSQRVARGGSWYYQPENCRSAKRFQFNPNRKSNDHGFRLVLEKYTEQTVKQSDKEKLSFNVNDVKFNMMPIQEGTFTMGSPSDEIGRDNKEVQHQVTISKDFYMAEFPVTQNLYNAVTGVNPSAFKNNDSGNNPVETISWDEAKKFCEELNKLVASDLPNGYRFDLPTEAQWEYACRAGTTTALNSGRELTQSNFCCPHFYEVGWNTWYSEGKTHPVGLKDKNGWNLYDMHGNVWEWCNDIYGDYSAQSVTDPEGPDKGQDYVVRGGSWYNNQSQCRSASRNKYNHSHKNNNIGFRLALVHYNAPAPRAAENTDTSKENSSAQKETLTPDTEMPATEAKPVSTQEPENSVTETESKPAVVPTQEPAPKDTTSTPVSTPTETPTNSDKPSSEEISEPVKLQIIPLPKELKNLQDFIKEKYNIELVVCPQGVFKMGSDEEELGHRFDEDQETVSFTKDFYIAKYLITQAQYKKIIGQNPSMFQGDDLPVEAVTWTDADNFCKKINEETASVRPEGYIFDLPTEAQWEYACRAGTRTSLNNGKNIKHLEGKCPNLDEVAWYVGNSDNKTHPIGQKKPNAWGIYDMHGNVCEWCKDWYSDYAFWDSNVNPNGPKLGTERVGRGGCFAENPVNCRSAMRKHSDPAATNKYIGIRIALVPVTDQNTQSSDNSKKKE